MNIDKNKKQKKCTRYMVKPQYGQYLGLEITKDTDVEDEEKVNEDGYIAVIQQIIKGTKFITETTIVNTLNKYKTKEISRVEAELPIGTILIWYPGKGYIVPNVEFKTVNEIKEDLDCLDFNKEEKSKE